MLGWIVRTESRHQGSANDKQRQFGVKKRGHKFDKARDKMRAEVFMATEPTEITGKVVNGVVVLDQPGSLQDGTTVRVQPLDKNSEARGKDINSLREMLLSHAGVIQDADLPPELAENLDHYLYGLPQRGERARIDLGGGQYGD
jgi:hypothetical protein